MTDAPADDVKATLFAGLRDVFQEKDIWCSSSTTPHVLALLTAICSTPARQRAIFAARGQLQPHLIILVNGGNIAFSDGLRTRLHPGDVVAVFPPISGG